MQGFDELTQAQQEAVLYNPKNLVGLSEIAVASKGSKSFAEWTSYKTDGIDLEPAFRKRLMEEEARVIRLLLH